MNRIEFGDRFSVLYNNITSNQAPGLDDYEKTVFINKAQDEVVKNHFLPQSNPKQAGYDDNQKRQADFSSLMTTFTGSVVTDTYTKINQHSHLFTYPSGGDSDKVFIVINEVLRFDNTELQVLPIRYDEYFNLSSKPFKRPVKGQAWRLMSYGKGDLKRVEIIAGPDYDNVTGEYIIRYVRRPKPIIVGNLGGLTINGYYLTGTSGPAGATATDGECELDEMLHEEILQRAVELAKIAWTATGQDNMQAEMAAGQRSE